MKNEVNSQVRTLARGLFILDLLKTDGSSTLTEIAIKLELNKSTSFRLLKTLADLGFVEYDNLTRKYSLGLQLIMYGRRVAHELQLRRIALPYLERMHAESKEIVALGVPYKDMVLWVDGLFSLSKRLEQLSFPWWVKNSYMHSTSAGKAMLAFFSDSEVDRIYREVGFPKRTEKTLTEIDVLRDELRQVRERGYAFDNQENFDELCCVGVPLFGDNDQVIGAISCIFQANRFKDSYPAVLPMLRQASVDISKTMGARRMLLLQMHK